MKLQTTKCLGIVVVALAAWFWTPGVSLAAETAALDPSGTWKLAKIDPNTKAKGKERTLKLKWEAGKLTGTIDDRSEVNGKVKLFEWPIKDGKLQGDELSFTVTHPPALGNGPDSTTKYEGKVTGNTMKGTAEMEWAGNTSKRDFEARRVKE